MSVRSQGTTVHFLQARMVGSPGGVQGRERRACRTGRHAFRDPLRFAPLPARAWGSAVKEMQGWTRPSVGQGLGNPIVSSLDDGPHEDEEFSHNRRQGHPPYLALGEQAVIERFHVWVEPDRGAGGQI